MDLLGILGDSLYARDDQQQRLYATSLAAVPTPDLTELDFIGGDEKTVWTIRKKLTHALLRRPGELKWERQPEWNRPSKDGSLYS